MADTIAAASIGDRPREMTQDLLGQADFVLGQRVGSVAAQPFPDGVCTQAFVRGHLEAREHPIERHGREIARPGGR
jgi:hypothetical protein